MIRCFITIAILLVIGCGKQSDKQPCQPFFTYDQLDHFHFDISEDSINQLLDDSLRALLPTKASQAVDILISDEEITVADTLRFGQLQELGFVRHNVADTLFARIDQLFCEPPLPEEIELGVSLCIPVYRDVLIFKKHNRIVGFVKLCIDCNQIAIVGTDRYAGAFGYQNEFQQLAAILNLQRSY